MLLNCGVGEDSWESFGLQGDPTSPYQRKSVLNIIWKDWCWSENSNILATWCKELTPWKRPWCWERLKTGKEGNDRGWDGWIASLTQWTWVWISSWSWWWTGRPGVLQSLGSQRTGHNWATELNWSEGTVHFRIVGCHSIKKRHYMWLLLVKVFKNQRKSCPWSGDIHYVKPSIDMEVSTPETQKLDQLWMKFS